MLCRMETLRAERKSTWTTGPAPLPPHPPRAVPCLSSPVPAPFHFAGREGGLPPHPVCLTQSKHELEASPAWAAVPHPTQSRHPAVDPRT